MHPGGSTVLVVDDEASLRLLCRVNLELEGYRVLEAATLDEARAALADVDVAVVLLDLHVGPEDGRDLLDELRGQETSTAVVLLTGAAEAEGNERADRVIVKPFEPAQLARVVEELANPDFRAHVDSSA